MKLRLENTDSKTTHELGNLIRSYNQSKREPSKSEPLNIYVEDEQGNLLAGMAAETFRGPGRRRRRRRPAANRRSRSRRSRRSSPR